MKVSFLISLFIALIITIFAVLNAAIIPINFIFAIVNISLALIIIISLIAGAAIVTILGIKGKRDLQKENKNYLKKINELQEENNNLKRSKNTSESEQYKKNS